MDAEKFFITLCLSDSQRFLAFVHMFKIKIIAPVQTKKTVADGALWVLGVGLQVTCSTIWVRTGRMNGLHSVRKKTKVGLMSRFSAHIYSSVPNAVSTEQRRAFSDIFVSKHAMLCVILCGRLS